MAMAVPKLFLLLFTIIFLVASSATAQENDKLPFSYIGATGPNNWGSLSTNFSACSAGKLQSPINIVTHKAFLNKDLKPLITNYHPTNSTLVDNGCNVGFHFSNYAGELILNGKNYSLKQLHWHSPSEHLINGVRYDAELHLVHIADDGNISVVGMVYRHGHSDPVITRIQNKLVRLATEANAKHEEAPIPLHTFNIKHMSTGGVDNKYYRYVGSLTTPPCTQNVIWNILAKVRTISREQIYDLKAPLGFTYKNNSRPAQPLNSRRVQLYEEHHL